MLLSRLCPFKQHNFARTQGKGPIRQVPSITNLLSVTIVEMIDGLLSFTIVLKLFPHE